MRNPKIKEVSARVVLTPMPEDGTEQFNFIRRAGSITANKVEALLEFNEQVEPKKLFRALNKLVSSYLCSGEKDVDSDDAIAIEHTYNYILHCWQSESDGFEMAHPTFLTE